MIEDHQKSYFFSNFFVYFFNFHQFFVFFQDFPSACDNHIMNMILLLWIWIYY